jgi:hypothetical protein
MIKPNHKLNNTQPIELENKELEFSSEEDEDEKAKEKIVVVCTSKKNNINRGNPIAKYL